MDSQPTRLESLQATASQPGVAEFVRHQLKLIPGLRGVDQITDAQAGEIVKIAYIKDPGLAAFLLPDSVWVERENALGRSAVGQFFGDMFQSVGGLAQNTFGAAGNIVTALGNNAQANAANNAATAQWNATLGNTQQRAQELQNQQAEQKARATKIAVIIVIVVVVAIAGIAIWKGGKS